MVACPLGRRKPSTRIDLKIRILMMLKHSAFALVTLSLFACGGGSSGGGSTPTPTPAPNPAPTPSADFTLNGNDQLRLYQAGDLIRYSYGFDETFQDGSGNFLTDGILDWQVTNDPYEVSFDDDRKSLLIIWETEYDSFREEQIYEQVYQYTGYKDDNVWLNNNLELLSDLDKVYLDGSSFRDQNDRLYCISYDPQTNNCTPIPTSPGTFAVGAWWEYEGVSSRNTLGGDNYEVKYSWEVTGVEIVETPYGNFEAYALEFYKEFFHQTSSYGLFHVTEGTYWYYPAIGIVKGEMLKWERFSGDPAPNVTIEINFELDSTNIPF